MTREIEAVFKLPEDYRVDRLPDRAKVELSGMRFTSSWRAGQNRTLRWQGKFQRGELEIGVEDYEQLKQFMIELRRAARSSAVISREAVGG